MCATLQIPNELIITVSTTQTHIIIGQINTTVNNKQMEYSYDRYIITFYDVVVVVIVAYL